MSKNNIYIISGLLILSAICIWIIYSAFSDRQTSQKNEVSLRTDVQDEFTIDNMLSAQNNKKGNENLPVTDNSSSLHQSENSDDTESLSRIQALIRENENAISQTQIASTVSEEEANSGSEIKLITPEDIINMQNKVKEKLDSQKQPVKKGKKKKKLSESPIGEKEPVIIEKRNHFNTVTLQKSVTRNAIKAYVHSEQTVQEGATLKMRVAEDCYTDNGIQVKRNSSVYGIVKKIDGERVIVEIQTVNVSGNILPFKRDVFSKDALAGIWVPGNAKADVSKDASAGAVDGTNIPLTGGTSMPTQLVGSVANAAMSGGKSAISKQVKKIKVTIKTNYEIYLMVPEKKDQLYQNEEAEEYEEIN